VSADATHAINYEKLFASIDEMDVESFLAFITPSGTFRFGSAPPVQGHAAIGEAVGGFFSSIAGVQHDVHRIVTDGDVAMIEGEVNYSRHDGSEISLPFVNVFEIEGVLISDYRIYIDIAPLFNP
jgi:limonene-1,2-epoxide hydrolase